MTLILAAKNRTGITFCYDTLVHDTCSWSGASTPREEPEHKVRDLSSLVALGMAGSFSPDGDFEEFGFWQTICELFDDGKALDAIKEVFAKRIRLASGSKEDSTFWPKDARYDVGIKVERGSVIFLHYAFGIYANQNGTSREGTYHLLLGNETTAELKSVDCCCLGYDTPEIEQRLKREYSPNMNDTELRKHLEDVLEFAKEVVNLDGKTILGGKAVSRLDCYGYQELSFE